MFRSTLFIGALALASGLTACTTMRQVDSPARYIESVRPKLVRITQNDGSRFFMIGPRLQSDTLMGFLQDPKRPMGEFRELPFSTVTRVEAQEYRHGRTLLAATGGVLGFAAIAYLFIHHQDTEGGQVN